MASTRQKRKIDRCPSCGQMPQLFDDSDETPCYMLSCQNMECEEQPSVCCCSKQFTIVMWNALRRK